MTKLFFLLTLLACIWASPTQSTQLAAFDDGSIPVEDQPDLDIFNVTLHARDAKIEKRALDLSYIHCNIIFDGQNNVNFQPFRVQGELIIFAQIPPPPGTQNGLNPVDVVISIGSPAVNPVAGSIRYVTNRYLNPFIGGSRDTTRVDFARVSTTASTVSVIVDTSVAAANQISVFNARSGLIANVYNPATGGFNLVIGANGQISGKIDMIGRSHISGGQAPYLASISGVVTKRGKITF